MRNFIKKIIFFSTLLTSIFGFAFAFDNVKSVNADLKDNVTIDTNAVSNFTYLDSGIAYSIKGEDKDIGNFIISYYYDESWNLVAPSNAGSYNVKITRDEDVEYNSFEYIINKGLVIDQKSVAEPTISGTYYYNQEEQTAIVDGVESFMSTSDSLTYTLYGTYDITYTLTDDNYKWEDGSDGVVTFTIIGIPVEEPKVIGTYVYNGESQKINFNFMYSYISTDDPLYITNAGSYTIQFELEDGYYWKDGSDGLVGLYMEKMAVSAPTLQTYEYTYTGENITIKPTGVASYMRTYDSLTHVNIGSYALTYILDNNHKWVDDSKASIIWKIVKGQANINLPVDTLYVNYGDKVILPEVTTNLGEVVCDTDPDSITETGTYIVKYSVADNFNYSGDEKELTVIISDVSVDEPSVIGTYTYNGQDQEIKLDGVFDFMSTTDSLIAKDVGTYQVTYTLPKKYVWAEGSDGVVTFTINKAKATIDVNTDDINVYCGETVNLPNATSNFGNVVVSYDDLVSPGVHEVTYSVEGTSNYDGDSKTIKVYINQIKVNEPLVSDTYIYSGDEISVNLVGVASYMKGSGTYKAINVGTYKINFTLEPKYTWAEGSDGEVSWTINKASNEIILDSYKNIVVTYGQEITLPTSSSKFGQVKIDTDIKSLVDAGEYEVNFIVDSTDNYDAASKTIKVIINKASVSKISTSGSYAYNGKEQSVVINGVNEYMSLDNSSIISATDVGKYTIRYNLDKNHVWERDFNGVLTWEISKGVASIEVDDETIYATYGDSITLPKASSNVGEVTCNYKESDLVNAGTYTIIYSVPETNNYVGNQKELTLVIAKKAIAEPKVIGKYEYNGKEQTALLNGYDDKIMTLQSSLTQTDAAAYLLKFKLNDNYKWAENSDGIVSFVINKAQVSISLDNTPITVYVGQSITLPKATSNYGEVTCDYTESDFKEVGTYKVTYSVKRSSNYFGAKRSLIVVVKNQAVAEPTVVGTYTYNGLEQEVKLSGFESYMDCISSFTKTNAGTYKLYFSLPENYEWAEGSDGVVLWTINRGKAVIDLDATESSFVYGESVSLPKASSNLGEIYCDTSASSIKNVGTYIVTYTVYGGVNYDGDTKEVTIIILPNEVTSKNITIVDNLSINKNLSLKVSEITGADDIALFVPSTIEFAKNENVICVYNIKLSNAKTGSYTIKLKIPEEEAENEVSAFLYIKDDTVTHLAYTINDGYLETVVSDLGMFALVTKEKCLTHYYLLLAGIIFMFIMLLTLLCDVHSFKSFTGKLYFFPVLIFELYTAALVVLGMYMNCMQCFYVLGLDVFCYLLMLCIFAFTKEHKYHF